MITSTVADYCRCCGCEKLFTYLDLGYQPLANEYHRGAGAKERFPLEVNVCPKCWHSQLSIVVNPKLMFDNYLYVSGTTFTFRQHCFELAKDAMEMVKDSPTVLDIACNDGTLLEAFQSLGADVYGVDPAQNLSSITEEKDIPVIVDYWGNYPTSELVRSCFSPEFDIIVATNVFAHVDNVDSFLAESLSVLSEDGVMILEFPYGADLFADNEFDTVYHEHLSYFLVNSFYALTSRLNLVIVKVVRTEIHGGSIRFYLKRQGIQSPDIEYLIYQEKEKGLHELDSYIEFSKRVLENKLRFKNDIRLKQREGKKIVGYGASAKGNTMLNYFNIKLDYIVDDNPLKWGYYTPGQDIIIRPPESLGEDGPLVVVILSWNFFKEIRKKIESIRGDRETYFMMYVPSTVVVI